MQVFTRKVAEVFCSKSAGNAEWLIMERLAPPVKTKDMPKSNCIFCLLTL